MTDPIKLRQYLDNLLCAPLEAELQGHDFDSDAIKAARRWTEREYTFEPSSEWVAFHARVAAASHPLSSTLIEKVRARISAIYKHHPTIGSQESLAGTILDSLVKRASAASTGNHPLDLINEIIILKFVKRAAERGQSVSPDELAGIISEQALKDAVFGVSKTTAQRLKTDFEREVLERMVKEKSLDDVVAEFAPRRRKDLVAAVWETVSAYLKEELQHLTANLQVRGALPSHGS